MNKISLPLWNVLPLLPQIQIPSRLLGMMMFLAAAWAGLVARQHKFVAMAIVILALYSNRNYLRPGYFERYHDDYYEHNLELLYGTTDPYGENMPVWSNFTQDTFADKIVADPRSPAKPTISNILINACSASFNTFSSVSPDDESFLLCFRDLFITLFFNRLLLRREEISRTIRQRLRHISEESI